MKDHYGVKCDDCALVYSASTKKEVVKAAIKHGYETNHDLKVYKVKATGHWLSCIFVNYRGETVVS